MKETNVHLLADRSKGKEEPVDQQGQDQYNAQGHRNVVDGTIGKGQYHQEREQHDANDLVGGEHNKNIGLNGI